MKRKIRNIAMLSLIAGSLSFYACGENKKEDDASQPMQNEMHQHEGEEEDHNHMDGDKKAENAKAEFQDMAVATAYEHYLEVKNALVESNVAKAGKYAKMLADNGKAEIATAAKKIAEANDINDQRASFSVLTKAMEPILKSAISSGKIYKQFCPMAFEGKGDYWYSSSEEIRNPYFGEKMLKCGRVDETIM